MSGSEKTSVQLGGEEVHLFGTEEPDKVWRVKSEFPPEKAAEVTKKWRPKDYKVMPLRYGQRLKVLHEEKHPGWSVGQFVDEADHAIVGDGGQPIEGS